MTDDVRAMYDRMASAYDKMVDAEIHLPIYTDSLGKLASAIAEVPGPVVDVACGSGQMLQRYHEHFDPERALIGLDLSPEMVAITRPKLPSLAEVRVADMREPDVAEASAVICWFALHHLPPAEAPGAIAAWARALGPGGRLSLATWEGAGHIDYGDAADIVAWRYSLEQVRGWVQDAGLEVEDAQVKPVEGLPMDAIYLDAVRPR